MQYLVDQKRADVSQTSTTTTTIEIVPFMPRTETGPRTQKWNMRGNFNPDDLLDNNTLYLRTKSAWTTFANGGESPLRNVQTVPPKTYQVLDSLGVSLTHLFEYVLMFLRKSRKYSRHFVVWFIIYYWETYLKRRLESHKEIHITIANRYKKGLVVLLKTWQPVIKWSIHWYYKWVMKYVMQPRWPGEGIFSI